MGALVGDGQREIGPAGTAARIGAGLVAIVVPIALWGVGWWDAAAALVGLPLLTTALGLVLTAAYDRRVPPTHRRRPALAWAPVGGLVASVLALGTAVTFVSPVNAPAIWVFLGVCALVAGVRGYGGCELMCFANLVGPRRPRVLCPLYTPIDALESARAARGAAPGPAAPRARSR